MSEPRSDAPKADWTGQYVLSAEPVEVSGWSSRRLPGGWNLTSHPMLPVVPVTVGGEEAGVLLGWPVDHAGRLVESVALPADASPSSTVGGFGGRWLLVTPEVVCPDATASQPAVFSAERGVVASSPGLIDAEDDDELIRAFDIVRRDGWYPFALTPKRGVRRLLPNHVLNLTDWKVQRQQVPPTASRSTEEAAAVVLEAVRTTGRAFATRGGLSVGLTAGRDSRMLLAALRNCPGTLGFYTARTWGPANATDVWRAGSLSRRFKFRHRTAGRALTTDAEANDWLDRVGWVRAGARVRNEKAGDSVSENCAIGHGAVGELARGYYWREGDTAERLPLARDLADRVGAPAISPVLAAAEAWRADLPDRNGLTALNLLYLEQRVGCWASPGNFGSPRVAPDVFLLSRRDAVDAMLSLKPDETRKASLMDEVIRQAWSELSGLPYNSLLPRERAPARVAWYGGRLADAYRTRLNALSRASSRAAR